jgi:hypothetical protein
VSSAYTIRTQHYFVERIAGGNANFNFLDRPRFWANNNVRPR